MKGSKMSEKKHAEKCSILGCIGHVDVDFECHQNGDTKLPKMGYKALAHFKTMEEILEFASKEMVRKLQAKYGRAGKFPTDRRVDVGADCKFEKTMQDRKAEFEALSPEAQQKYRDELQALLGAISK
jgi:hypothetical protein